MNTELQNVLIVTLFCGAMLAANLKAGRSWSGALLKWATYLLLLAGIGALAWLTFVAVFR